MYLPFIINNINQTLELNHYNEYTKHIQDKIYRDDIRVKLIILYLIILIYVILWCFYDIIITTTRRKLKLK